LHLDTRENLCIFLLEEDRVKKVDTGEKRSREKEKRGTRRKEGK
jgi:hypothetical protein